MHRSATSLTANILSSYGIYTGQVEDLVGADRSNQKGHFENKHIVLLNNKILYEHYLSWATLPKENIIIKNTKYKDEIDNIINTILEKSSDNQDIFIKDPRMCLLGSLWRQEFIKFKLRENIIVIFRHPFEVAKSLQIRDNMNFAYALKLWFYYNFNILNYIFSTNVPVLIINYEDYFLKEKKQVKKLEKFINHQKTNNFESESIISYFLHHNSVKELNPSLNVELEQMILELYKFMLILSNKKSNITKSHLKKYEEYLKKMMCTSYEYNDKDIFPISIKNSIGREKKKWCIYQLQNKDNILVEKFRNYFNEHKITKLFLYGNGTITDALMPVLYKAHITIEKILDIKYKENLFIYKNISYELYILNTVVNYGDEVDNYLLQYFTKDYIIDVYMLLNEFLLL